MPARRAGRTAQPITAEDEAGFVAPGMWLDDGFGICQPDVVDAALAEAAAPNSRPMRASVPGRRRHASRRASSPVPFASRSVAASTPMTPGAQSRTVTEAVAAATASRPARPRP